MLREPSVDARKLRAKVRAALPMLDGDAIRAAAAVEGSDLARLADGFDSGAAFARIGGGPLMVLVAEFKFKRSTLADGTEVNAFALQSGGGEAESEALYEVATILWFKRQKRRDGTPGLMLVNGINRQRDIERAGYKIERGILAAFLFESEDLADDERDALAQEHSNERRAKPIYTLIPRSKPAPWQTPSDS